MVYVLSKNLHLSLMCVSAAVFVWILKFLFVCEQLRESGGVETPSRAEPRHVITTAQFANSGKCWKAMDG